MELKFQVQSKIQKPLAEVFDAVYNPDKLKAYFTTRSASGPLREGTTVSWSFADYSGPMDPFMVTVKRVVPNELIAFEWPSGDGGYNTTVEMRFESLGPNNTLVKIAEWGWRDTQPGLESSYGNCFGWTQMLCSLKAFAEYGINLRKGFY